MRLGGPIFEATSDPDSWITAVKKLGYRAAYCPVGVNADEQTIRAYADAAAEADIAIAEVGAWSNPISKDEDEQQKAIANCQARLALADQIGARCCVNIAGSRSAKWDGPSSENLTRDTFDRIVVSVQEIIDHVQPTRTYYTLETMPWVFPDSADTYLELIQAIDRKRFAVHLDPVNLVNSPRRYYGSGALILECFQKLGTYLRSCHAKDILLDTRLTVHLDEVRPGLGGLDYVTYLRELNRLDPDIPLMLEHLPSAEEYALAAQHVRSVAHQEGIAGV